MQLQYNSLLLFIKTHPWIIIIALFVLGLTCAFISFKMKPTRRKEIKKTAAGKGWKFDPELHSPKSLFDRTGLDFFNKNVDPYAENFIYGIRKDHYEITYFDYICDEIINAAQNEEATYMTQFFSCALIEFDGGNIPSFSIEPETLLTREGEKLGTGQKDIDFDEFPEFSDNYYLYGSDEPAIRQFFNGNIISIFEKNKGLHAYTSGKSMLIVAQRIGTHKINDFIVNAQDVADVIGAEIKY